MKKIVLFIFSILIIGTAFSQDEQKFMLQSKLKGMYFLMKNSKPVASTYYYGLLFSVNRGELIINYTNGEEKMLQIIDNEIVLQTQTPMTVEESRQLQLERANEVPASESKVKMPVQKSTWYFEPAEEEGYFYIVCPYEPFVGHCLTITSEYDDKNFKVELVPIKPSLNDDQKWQLIYVP